MKKYLDLMFYVTLLAVTLCMSSCSDSNDDPDPNAQTEGEKLLEDILEQNVDGTINPTYKALASDCETLYNQMQTIRNAAKTKTVTQAMVDAACNSWKSARANYEKSEAFLMGAAADFSIDPHIDSWPLDLDQLWTLLSSPNMVNKLDGEDGPEYANTNLGPNLLGFHGVEFILFRDGNSRKAEEFNGYDTYNKDGLDFTSFSGEYEMVYALAVCGDLRNSCYRMETAWNEDAPKAHIAVMEELEWGITLTSGKSYGENMKDAGEPGSTYYSVKNAISAILVGDGGAAGIADEVGLVKIGNPHTGADVNYIESPYSYNSLTDFYNNMESIKNVWMGGIEGSRVSGVSLSAWFAKYNPTVGKRVEDAIASAQAAINAIPKPFVLNYTSSACDAAMDACDEVVNALNAANDYIQNSKD